MNLPNNMPNPLAYIPTPLHGKFQAAASTLELTNEELFARVIEYGLVKLVRDLNALQCFEETKPSNEPIEEGAAK